MLIDHIVGRVEGEALSSLSYDYPYSKNASGNGVDIYIVGKTIYRLCSSRDLEQFLLRYWRAHHPCVSSLIIPSEQLTGYVY